MPNIIVLATNAGESAVPGGAPAYEVRLEFLPLRTRFVKATVLEPKGLGTVSMSAPTSSLVWLAWERPLEAEAPIRLWLEYVGEPPPEDPRASFNNEWARRLSSLKTAPWMAEHADELVQARTEFVEMSRGMIENETDALLAGFVESRNKEIDRAGDGTLQSQMNFFSAYDRATSLAFVYHNPSLARCILHAQRVLGHRVVRRAVKMATNPSRTVHPFVMRTLSDLQLKVFRDHFPDSQSTSQIDVTKFRNAFVSFSTGRLAQRSFGKWNGRPNSAFFFAFAEFAIHAIESGESVEAWTALLPTFVMCQALYTEVYAPYCIDPPPGMAVPRSRRTFVMYEQDARTPENLEELIRQVLTDYGSMKPSDVHAFSRRHTENANSAFPLGETGVDRPCDAIPI